MRNHKEREKMSEAKKRKFHTPEFKAKVGSGGIARGKDDQRDRSGIRCTSITVGHWKKELQEQAKTLFEGKRGPTSGSRTPRA